MARYDIKSPRLFVQQDLSEGVRFALERGQANYLVSVLRLGEGAAFLAFNGRDGEWRVRLAGGSRKHSVAQAEERTRPQSPPSDLWYLFAPLKSARLDYMVQKATEMGAGSLIPVITRRTQASRVNLERMRANVIEAAEQCGILSIPDVQTDVPLERLLTAWPADRALIFCDEDAEAKDPLEGLRTVAPGSPMALVVGPEGGFDEDERAMLLKVPSVVRLSLGPRILRADTAAVAALAVVQAVCGDWQV